MLFPQKSTSSLLPTFWISHLRSISFLNGCLPPRCIPSLIFSLHTEQIYEPQLSPGLGRKIARRHINNPISIAQENTSTGVRLWHSGSWKYLHPSPTCDYTEHEHAQLMPTPGIWGREKRFGMALTNYFNNCFLFIIKVKWRNWRSQVRVERGETTKIVPRESVLPNLIWIKVSR